MSNNKYLVVKKSDFDELFAEAEGNGFALGTLRRVLELELPDAEVIRHQDIASPQMFHHYSGVMLSLIELALKFNLPVDVENLQRIADHFHEAGMAAESVEHKIPD